MWQLIPTVNSWNSLLPFGFPLSITEKTATSYLAKWSNPAISMISKHRIDLCYPQGYARGLRIHHLRVLAGARFQPPTSPRKPRKVNADPIQGRRFVPGGMYR